MGIRVPRITLSADYGDDAFFGELRPLSLGYGLHQAWIFATMFGAASVFGVDPLLTGANNSAASLTFIVSIVVYALVLLFGALTDQKFLSFYVSRKTTIGASVALAAGTLLLLPPFDGTADVAVQVVAGAITGISSGLLILQWGTAFARHEQPTIVTNTAIAIAIGVAVYVLVLRHVPFPACGVVAALLPLFEMVFLLMETPKPYTERNDYPIFQPLPIRRGAFFLKFGAPVAVFGIALGTLRQTSIQTILPAASVSDQLIAVLASCCALVLVLVTLLALKSASGWNRLFRPLIPFVAVVVFFFPTAELPMPTVSTFALLVGYMSFEALLWISFGELSQQYRLSPVFVVGLGRGVQALTSLIGSLIPIFAVAWAEFLPMGSSTVIMVLLLAMIVAYALLPSESEIRKLVLDCPIAHVIDRDKLDHLEVVAKVVSQAPSAASGDSEESTMSGDQGAENAADGDGESESSALAGPSAKTESGESDTAAAPTAKNPEEASADALDANASGTAKSASAAASEPPVQTLQTAPADASAPSDLDEAKASGKQSDSLWPSEKRGRFKRKCEATANRYLLSARETEVLFFLAKGHNATSIQEQLFISEGTAKTHIRHIYRKLDVHSQQELIQIVENAEID